MTGYRQHSYDPNAWEEPAPPARPFNWVQWTGVGFAVLGGLFWAAYVLARIGIIPQVVDSALPFIMMTCIGAVLVNSRRQPAREITSAVAAKRRRWLAIAAILFAILVAAAAFIDIQGAN